MGNWNKTMAWALAIGGALGAWLVVDGCSFGNAVTPVCAGGGGGPGCDPPPKCDQGNGLITQSDECCAARGNDQYGFVCMQEQPAGSDFRVSCAAADLAKKCEEAGKLCTKNTDCLSADCASDKSGKLGCVAPRECACCNAAKVEYNNCLKGMK